MKHAKSKSVRNQGQTVLEPGDKFCEIPAKDERKRKAAKGLVPFRCYLGHYTYAPDADLVHCLECNAASRRAIFTAQSMCVCGCTKAAHNPHCITCGMTEETRTDAGGNDREAVVPNCPLFTPME